MSTLAKVMGNALTLAQYEALLPGYENAMRAANINNHMRAAMFAAQLGHESVGLKYMQEIASGADYEWRSDLGNVYAGDGRRYKGRGPIQLTGRNNYRAFTKWARANGHSALDFEAEPTLLEQPHWGFLAASWYWVVARGNLNKHADAGDLFSASADINGWIKLANGTWRTPNGYADRQARYNRARTMGDSLLPRRMEATMEKVLDYSRDQVAQDTGYNCGPASVQTVMGAATGTYQPESELAKRLGTHTGGTDWIGQFPKVLNALVPGSQYKHVEMPNDPPNQQQRDRLWDDIVQSINAGHGVVANIVAPPGNYPRAVAPSTQHPKYAGGTVYHYIAIMGYSDGGQKRYWVADSGFFPFGYWISHQQLTTLIPPKGYAYSTAAAKDAPTITEPENGITEKELSMSDISLIIARLDAIEGKVNTIEDQLMGPDQSKLAEADRNPNGGRGWRTLGSNAKGQWLTLVDAMGALRQDNAAKGKDNG